MHKLALFAFVTTVLAAPAVADEPTTLYLTSVCDDGCLILINFEEGARFDADSELAGEFTLQAVNDPMTCFEGLVTTETGFVTYRLVSEPGNPMFSSISQVQAYMEGINNLIDNTQVGS